MRLRILLFIALLSFAATPAAAQGVLPSSFAGWAADASTPPEALSAGVTQVPQAVLAEYGWTQTESRQYLRGKSALNVSLHKLKDSSGSYGLYSFLRTPDMPRAEFTEHSSMSQDRSLVLIGNLVVEVRGKELAKSRGDLKALVAAVCPQAQSGLFPTMSDHLPRHGLIERTDHYVLGPVALYQFLPVASNDWLGFSQGAEAELARYRAGGHEITLLIADFPTPQAAQKKLTELQQRLNLNKANFAGGVPALYARRSLTLLAIVSGAQTQGEADVLLQQVSSTAEVTWNEPNFELTQPGMGAVIYGAIIGTGIVCAFAVISGIAFGGVRLAVKRIFPGKVFDRSSQMQVLQMGLTSKPINAEDFYGLGNPPPR
jgi:uncharacterized protein DUF6599